MITTCTLTAEQIPLLFPIGHAFSAEAGRDPFNEEVFSRTWETMLKLGFARVYVLMDVNTVVGALGAMFVPDPFSGVLTAAENFWYVLPEHRKSGVGIALLNEFEEDAKAAGCKQILMVHFAQMGARLQALYESRGYVLLEQTFRKGI
jgi:GNAT superfamily N-acetyltransferase